MPESSFIRVQATRRFQRNLRKLSKKYPNIRQDVQPILQQIQQGQVLGDRLSKIGYEVFKLRVRNSDIQKGKSGGYRLIYYLKTARSVILLTVYSKSQQANIAADNIQSIISEYESEK